ncbi:MAG TPA: metal-dependent hydrolase [Gammaproteobacteria bacterium]|nr:metal-dependent hydrolase [Gammaproteobacteria bacterium]
MFRKSLLVCFLGALVFFQTAASAKNVTTLTWYGHAAFKLVTPSGHVLLLDPWITNPSNPNGKQDLEALKHVDYILVTHGHFDHVGDAVEIAKRTGAHLVANFDLGHAMVDYLGFPPRQAGFDTLGNSGGTITLLNGEVSVTFEPAVHSSDIELPGKDGKAGRIVAGGNPNGFVIRIKDGPTIYDTGDTALFSDMRLIGTANHIDVMLVCIGDHFTMGPMAAAEAVDAVNPDVVIPMHYGTFPVLTGTPAAFEKALADLEQVAVINSRGSKAAQTHQLAKKLRIMAIDKPVAFESKD